MHEDTVWVTCSSWLRVLSTCRPRSRADWDGVTFFPRRVTWKSAGSLWSIWRVPNTSSLVFSGFYEKAVITAPACDFFKSLLICKPSSCYFGVMKIEILWDNTPAPTPLPPPPSSCIPTSLVGSRSGFRPECLVSNIKRVLTLII